MPSSPNPHRHAKTGRSECVPGLWLISDVSKLICLFLLLTERTQKAGESTGLSRPRFGWHPFTLDTCNGIDTSATTTHKHPHTSTPWCQARV